MNKYFWRVWKLIVYYLEERGVENEMVNKNMLSKLDKYKMTQLHKQKQKR